MTYKYKPEGVCSKEFIFQIENNTIISLEVLGGCPGNALGISSLISGQTIDDVINKLEGIQCGNRKTSCPDQMARALQKFKKTGGLDTDEPETSE